MVPVGSRQTFTEAGGGDPLSREGWSQEGGEEEPGEVGGVWGLVLDFELISEVSYIV